MSAEIVPTVICGRCDKKMTRCVDRDAYECPICHRIRCRKDECGGWDYKRPNTFIVRK